jgi:choline kinase
MVLAAGKGERLRPLTDALPKTLLPVDAERTILDVVLANFAAVGLERAVVVTGFAAERVDARLPELERRHGLAIETVFNPKAEDWNNAYSLWCAREHFGAGVLLSNGDTVHPPSVEEDVLAARGNGLTLAVDRHKRRGAEEM